jgi:hypothetical protein
MEYLNTLTEDQKSNATFYKGYYIIKYTYFDGYGINQNLTSYGYAQDNTIKSIRSAKCAITKLLNNPGAHSAC